MAALGDRTRGFFEAYGRGDLTAVRAALADDLIAYVTNAEGGADVVKGADAYMGRLPNLRDAGGSATVTQVLEIDEQRVMTMVEIRASREGRGDLHNFAAFLARIADGRIAELWMVEAQPAHSDEFWS